MIAVVFMAQIILPAMPQLKLYVFSVTVGAASTRQFRTFQDLAEKLKMDVTELMKQCNGKAQPSKALVKGLARELNLDVGFLEKLAEEVRRDLGAR
jgi:transcriptional regulator with XRE-family HTH domain